jgi:hypothetical protein
MRDGSWLRKLAGRFALLLFRAALAVASYSREAAAARAEHIRLSAELAGFPESADALIARYITPGAVAHIFARGVELPMQ